MSMKANKKNYIGWSLIVFLVLIALIRLGLSPFAVSAINSWFEQQGIESEVKDLSFDLSKGTISLSGLHGDADGNELFRLDRVNLGWSWSALFDKQIRLNRLEISGLVFDVDRGPGKRLVIAGIDLEKLAATDAEAATAAPGQPPQWSISLPRLKIENFKLCYRALPQHDYCNSFEVLGWEGRIVLDLAQSAAPVLPLIAEGNFTLTNLKVHNNLLGRDMFGFDEFAMREVRVDTLDDIAIKTIALDALTLFERPTDAEHTPITRLKTIRLEQLRLAQMSHLDIAEVQVQGHEALIVSLSSNQLEIKEWLEQFTADESLEDTGATDEAAAAFTFAIAKLNYQTEKSLAYRDESFAKPFIFDLHSIELKIENLDSRQAERASQMHYVAKLGQHASITIDGDITPLDPKPSFDLTGRIEGMDLRYLSPVTSRSIGHKIKSGQLDADLKLKAEHNILNSNLKLKLHHFDLDALNSADKEKIDSSFGFPLDSSLSLLKDRDDNIDLEIPITGDLQNPDFDPTDAITKATSSAITTAVLNYYTPFGLVTLADGLFSLATALNFDPVIFDSGSDEFTPSEQAGLDKIAGLMRERPGIYLTLCPFTDSADRKLLLPETAEIAADELELESEQLEQLANLGEIRAAAVKDFLVTQKLDPARLVLCAPEHVESEGAARVEITI